MTIRESLESVLYQALKAAVEAGELPLNEIPQPSLEPPAYISQNTSFQLNSFSFSLKSTGIPLPWSSTSIEPSENLVTVIFLP